MLTFDGAPRASVYKANGRRNERTNKRFYIGLYFSHNCCENANFPDGKEFQYNSYIGED